jgi:hypothetical protein
MFHISQLKKCLRVLGEQLQLEELNVQDDLTYTKYPLKILDTLERITQSKRIRMSKVQWSHHGKDMATREREDELQAEFPNSLLAQPNLEDEIPIKGDRFVTP